ncbi:MAG: hypothetical protein NW201_14485 [Gemmatimonadales bacterium]|nr:hypothetical protein [Gemmatimonadales bacterium]
MLVWPVAVVAVLAVAWYSWRRQVRVPCSIDLEATHDHFHAHVELEGVEVQEGDEVLVHGAPDRVAYGEKRRMRAEATVQQASWPRRLMTRVIGTSHITELYEVGFEG